jgi:hypothetical protein
LQEARQLAEQCCQAEPSTPEHFDLLAVVCAAGGDFPQAVQAARKAVSLAEEQGKHNLAAQISARLQAYESGRMR